MSIKDVKLVIANRLAFFDDEAGIDWNAYLVGPDIYVYSYNSRTDSETGYRIEIVEVN